MKSPAEYKPGVKRLIRLKITISSTDTTFLQIQQKSKLVAKHYLPIDHSTDL